ncbi:MAG TPA: hypothetical protein VF522_00905 [Ramlibacter sp.]|uniref:hypothetical protein n=1 Tax=Ramlibacter sp. TaxID=1917967 RepID=UPI002ED47250
MRSLRLFFIAALLAALAGCASVAPGVPASVASAPQDRTGWVFGSLGTAGSSPITSHGFFYRAKGASDAAIVSWRYDGRSGFASPLGLGKVFSDKPDFREGIEAGIAFAYRLPAGEYELYDVRFHMDQATYNAKEKFSVPFRVEAGSATYLGEFIARDARARNFFGMPIKVPGYYAIRQRVERDLDVLAARGIDLPRDRIIDASAGVLGTGLPFFQENRMPAARQASPQ